MENTTVIKVIAAAMVLIGLSTYLIFTFNTVSGSPLLWEASAEEPVLQFYPVAGGAYLVGEENVSLVNSSGQSIWSIRLFAPLYSALGNDSPLYVYSSNHSLWSISPEGVAESLGTYDIDRPPVPGNNGTVYLCSGTKLTAVGPPGLTEWDDTNVISDPVVDGAGNVYYLVHSRTRPSEVYLQSRSSNGSLQWSNLLDNYDDSTTLLPHGSGVFVSRSGAGELFRVLENGTILWKYYKPYLGHYLLSADPAGQLYLIYDQGTVHVLNDQGDLISKFSAGSTDVSSVDGAAPGGGLLYTAVRDDTPASVTITATDLNGTRQWTVAVNSTGSIILTATGSGVCAATELSRSGKSIPVLSLLDDRGHVQYNYYGADQGRWDQVCAAHGVLYARTGDGRLYALKLPGASS